MNTTGLAHNTAKTVKLYPNPTRGILHLNLDENGSNQLTVRITNIIGKVLYENNRLITRAK
ncbi:MAG: T9SS type A sorting domain-containing protein [Bacteroidales bacterium]